MIRFSRLKWVDEAWEFLGDFQGGVGRSFKTFPIIYSRFEAEKILRFHFEHENPSPSSELRVRRSDGKSSSIRYWFWIIRTSLRHYRTHIELYTYLICASSLLPLRSSSSSCAKRRREQSNLTRSPKCVKSNLCHAIEGACDGAMVVGENEKLISLLLIPSITSSAHNPI